ncbi:hypothetical protein, partial [Marinobacterium weihaiense]|nr:hypothetical protein [Marinobacterium weihaiense]
SKPPIMAMKEWHKTHPELFKKRPYNHAGLDTYEQQHQQYEQQVAEWNSAWAAHQQQEEQRADAFHDQLGKDQS